MIDVKTADRELQTYIRPQTFPVAIRMLKPGEPIPDRARRPARDFKKLTMICQVIDMSRRYGWMIALTREDHICSLGITAIGFDKPLPIYNVGTLCEGMYTETKEAGQRSEAAIDKFAPGEYETPAGGAAGPRHLRAARGLRLRQPRPGDAADPGRAVEAGRPAHLLLRGPRGLRRHHRHHHADRRAAGHPPLLRATASSARPRITRWRSPSRGRGWRRSSRACAGTHNGGIRYPITQFMEYEAKLPPRYMEVNKLWDAEKGKSAASPTATAWWPPTSGRSRTACRSTRSWPRSRARWTG